MEDLTGKQFGPYRIVAPLGEGGMAAVYRAYQANVDRYVALKVLPRYFASDPSFVGRFEQEAKVVARLQHPHILPVYDFGEAEGYTYIVMPFVEGGTLTDLMSKGRLRWPQIQVITNQVGDALDYAHSLGLIHRDVKPTNILVDGRGNSLLSDFGIAKIVAGTATFTRTGGSVGTPAYMSPEQIKGEELDGRSDIYSLGIVLYEMATGRVPYQAETPPAIFVKHLHDPLPPPHIHRQDIPEGVERVILKALAKERQDRYNSGHEMAAALASGIASRPAAVPTAAPVRRPVPPRQPQQPAPKRYPSYLIVLAIAALGLFCLLAAGGAFLAFSGLPSSDQEGEGQLTATPTHTATRENGTLTPAASATAAVTQSTQEPTATSLSPTQTPIPTLPPAPTSTAVPTAVPTVPPAPTLPPPPTPSTPPTPTTPPTFTPVPSDTPPPFIPSPDLIFNGTENYESGGKQWVRYRLLVQNASAFPAEMFEPAPDLPPCGSNNNAARTWVDIVNALGDSRLYGFCALSSSDGLKSLWFAVEQGAPTPANVYVVLKDRREGINYASNSVPLP